MLAGNKPSLWQRNRELFAACAAPASCAGSLDSCALRGDFEFEESPDCEFPSCRAGEKRLLLHSRRDPLGEARRQVRAWIEEMRPDLGGVVLTLGFGGLHHLCALSELMQPGGLLFVAEPRPDFAAESLKHFELEPILKDGVKLIFSVSEKIQDISDEFRFQLRQREDFAVSIFIQPAIGRAWPELYRELEAKLRRELKLEAMNRATSARYSELWQRNSLMNLPLALESPRLELLTDAFAGRPAVILGAGPSLDEAMPFLQKIRHKAVFVAVGTALKSLLRQGLRPDFVLAVDSVPAVMRQFEAVPPDSAWLLTHQQAPPDLLRLFKGRSFLFSANLLGGFNAWLESFDALPMRLTVGGTVAMTAMDAAIAMGCRDIVLAGLDLAFRDDGVTHASSSVYDGHKEEVNLVSVRGNTGGMVRTSSQFAGYIEMLNNYFHCECKERGVRFHNLALKGAALGNTQMLSPEGLEAFSLPFTSFDAQEITARLLKNAQRPDKARILAALDSMLAELEDFEKTASSAMQACQILRESGGSATGRLGAELERLDLRLKGMRVSLSLLSGYLRLFAEECCARGVADKDALLASFEFYGKCAESAAEARGLIGNARTVLGGQAS